MVLNKTDPARFWHQTTPKVDGVAFDCIVVYLVNETKHTNNHKDTVARHMRPLTRRDGIVRRESGTRQRHRHFRIDAIGWGEEPTDTKGEDGRSFNIN